LAAVVLSRSEVSRLQDAHAELCEIQESVTAAIDRIGSNVRQGASANDDDRAQLENWQARLCEAALTLKEELAAFTLAALGDAIEAVIGELAAEEQNVELRRMLGEITAVALDGKTRPLLEPVVQQVRTADPVTMSDETRQTFYALYRVLSTPLHAVDMQDFEAVQKAFG
jgi:hypothetical protein